MKHLWAPWRLKYIKHVQETSCIFCEKTKERRDKRNLILDRGKLCFALLNLYPYNSGHFMVAPYQHTGDLSDIPGETLLEMFELLEKVKKVIQKIYRPQGYNVGVNLGRVSGAGIVDHVHLHVVPRWNGDTNFMPVLAGTKVIPQALSETYDAIKKNL